MPLADEYLALTTSPADLPRRFHMISLVPLGFAALELAWAFCLMVAVAQAKGGLSQTRTQTHTLDALGMLPAVMGIIAAAFISFRSPQSILDRAVVTIGILACLPLLIAFGKELMTP